MKFKRNLVSTLTYRALNICSNFININTEFQFIRRMLFNNGFPFAFSDTHIGKVLNKFVTTPKMQTTSVSRKPVFFKIPYTGNHSFSIKKNLTRLLKDHYPQVHLKVVFTSINRLSKMFKIKDKVPQDLISCVIYKYQCVDCNATYVGKCSRHFKARIYEHLGRSYRTGNYLTKPAYSAIRDHCENSSHRLNKENFSIISSARSDSDLCIMEALLQYRIKPTLGRISYELLCF